VKDSQGYDENEEMSNTISGISSQALIDPSTGKSGGTAGSDELGKSDFLKLLLAQMQNQDPMDPMKDTEFIAQMAQFQSLEEMENLNTNVQAMLSMQQATEATALIGKTVEAKAGSDSPVSGVVSEVDLSSGAAVLIVDGQAIYMTDVVRIS
jgi:flagellar basal-body rod modification protein FlgD